MYARPVAPCRYVIPYIQRRVVEELRKRGMSNTGIAERLGITPSAVTRYLKGERGVEIDLSNRPDMEALIEGIAEAVAREGLDKYGAMTAIAAATAYALSRRYLCSYHARIDEGIDPAKCNVCIKAFGNTEKAVQALIHGIGRP